MKKLFFILLVIPALCIAEENLDTELTQACERHSASLIARIKTDVIENVSQTEAQQMMALSMETCTAYFKRVFAQQETTPVGEESNSSEKRNWLTEKVLSGDSTRTDGHKRLQKRH